MAKWHPATKVLIAVSLLAVPYLFWSQTEEPAPAVAASVTRAVPSEAETAAEQPPAPYVLPPLESFTAVVERPLFSPTRRMPNPPPEVDTPTQEAPVAAPSGPAEPELRFFGTVTQGGVAAALVTYPSTSEVARLRPGDMVGDWQVISVNRNKLELGLGDDRRSYEIFGQGMRAAPQPQQQQGEPQQQAEPAAPESSTPNDGEVPGVDPQGDADYGDDAPGQE